MTPEVPYPLHKPEEPATYVERKSRTRRRWVLFFVIVMLLLMLVGLVLAMLGIYGAVRMQTNKTATFSDPIGHFAHGSIGARLRLETDSPAPARRRRTPRMKNGAARRPPRAVVCVRASRRSGAGSDLPCGW